MAEPALEGAYRDGHELERDVDALIVSLRACHGQQALAVEAERWFDLTRVFGLHLTRLDVRQDATRYREVMSELLQISGDCGNFAALSEPQRQAMLVKTMGSVKLIDEECLAPSRRRRWDCFECCDRLSNASDLIVWEAM